MDNRKYRIYKEAESFISSMEVLALRGNYVQLDREICNWKSYKISDRPQYEAGNGAREYWKIEIKYEAEQNITIETDEVKQAATIEKLGRTKTVYLSQRLAERINKIAEMLYSYEGASTHEEDEREESEEESLERWESETIYREDNYGETSRLSFEVGTKKRISDREEDEYSGRSFRSSQETELREAMRRRFYETERKNKYPIMPLK